MGVKPAIDWGTAQRVGELVAGLPSVRRRPGTLGPAARARLCATGGRAHRPAAPRRAAAAGDDRPTGLGRGQPQDDAPAARLPDRIRRRRQPRPGGRGREPDHGLAAFRGRPPARRPARRGHGPALPTCPGSVRHLAAGSGGAAATAAAGAQPGGGGAQSGRRSRRADRVGRDPRDHPRRAVLRSPLAARAPGRDASRAAGGPAGLARGRRRARRLRPGGGGGGRRTRAGRPTSPAERARALARRLEARACPIPATCSRAHAAASFASCSSAPGAAKCCG